MKEIWIEKLGELLREYSYKNHDYHWTLYVSWKFEWSVPWTDHDLNKEEMWMVIKSKEYWFIKWLVENDKINLDDQAMQYAKSDLSKFFTEWKDKNWMSDDYAMLLMLLSIQDEPIRFLCEIIK